MELAPIGDLNLGLKKKNDYDVVVLLENPLVDLLMTHEQHKSTILNLIANKIKINGHILHARVKQWVGT